MLDCLPCEDVPDGVVPPTPQPREVCIGIAEGERAVHKRDVVAVKELVRDVRGLIRGRGELGIGGAVDAVERDLTVVRVTERPPVDMQSHLGHGKMQGEEREREEGKPSRPVWRLRPACAPCHHRLEATGMWRILAGLMPRAVRAQVHAVGCEEDNFHLATT
jgi:hypothetical protein